MLQVFLFYNFQGLSFLLVWLGILAAYSPRTALTTRVVYDCIARKKYMEAVYVSIKGLKSTLQLWAKRTRAT